MARMLTLQVERLTADGNWQGDGRDITVQVSSMADLRATLGVSSTSVVFMFDTFEKDWVPATGLRSIQDGDRLCLQTDAGSLQGGTTSSDPGQATEARYKVVLLQLAETQSQLAAYINAERRANDQLPQQQGQQTVSGDEDGVCTTSTPCAAVRDCNDEYDLWNVGDVVTDFAGNPVTVTKYMMALLGKADNKFAQEI